MRKLECFNESEKGNLQVLRLAPSLKIYRRRACERQNEDWSNITRSCVHCVRASQEERRQRLQ